MSRKLCDRCTRPETACICSFFVSTDNKIPVVILRHPKETGHAKNTVPLLENSLTKIQIVEGEDFTENLELKNILQDTKKYCLLLYPSPYAKCLTELNIHQHYLSKKNEKNDKQPVLILLDATWKKAYRMFMLSKNLHDIDHVVLPENIEGQYEIRKTSKTNGLSTFEAAINALKICEDSPQVYEKLQDSFTRFNQFQMAYRNVKN